ncbi:hypothetical protein [Embleya sp. NPDC005971]|uniref:hypothetical protein n=1 Tax=unclassified Embleya TaxID=2699296 RepID=UPI0033C5C5B8
MSDTTGGITQEQVRERAARIRAGLERWKVEGFDPTAALDVEAVARGALQARARPKPTAHDVLNVIRPEWEKEAAQQGLTGEAVSAFAGRVLAEDGPKVYCESYGVWYFVHLNKKAVELIGESAEMFNAVLELAAMGDEFVEDIVTLLEAFVVAEVAAIKGVSESTSNGQVALVGVYPVPIPVVQSDADYDWDAEDAAGWLGHHIH